MDSFITPDPQLITQHSELITSSEAPVAQWIEHQTTDLGVGGSSPSGRTNKSSGYEYMRYKNNHVDAV